MGIVNCAHINADAQGDFIETIGSWNEGDIAFFQTIWSMFYPNGRLQRLDELQAAPGWSPPVWVGWRMNENGLWYDPAVPPGEPEE